MDIPDKFNREIDVTPKNDDYYCVLDWAKVYDEIVLKQHIPMGEIVTMIKKEA